MKHALTLLLLAASASLVHAEEYKVRLGGEGEADKVIARAKIATQALRRTAPWAKLEDRALRKRVLAAVVEANGPGSVEAKGGGKRNLVIQVDEAKTLAAIVKAMNLPALIGEAKRFDLRCRVRWQGQGAEVPQQIGAAGRRYLVRCGMLDAPRKAKTRITLEGVVVQGAQRLELKGLEVRLRCPGLASELLIPLEAGPELTRIGLEDADKVRVPTPRFGEARATVTEATAARIGEAVAFGVLRVLLDPELPKPKEEPQPLEPPLVPPPPKKG